jgi:hypothetical protein
MSASPESRKAVERREQLARARAARARRDPAVGLVLIWSGVGIWMVIFLVLVVLWLEGVNLGSWPGVTATPVVVVSLALVTRGRRMRAGGAERVLTEDSRAPVVYLRPFGADGAEIAKRVSSRVRIAPSERVVKTYEERLAHALRKIGPFVAVGNPAERLPLLGAARMYAADEDWQAAVGDLIGRAAIVLLHAGEGHGLDWEVHHVIDRGLPERTILSLPLDAKRGEPSRQERYATFRRRSDGIFPRPLPEAIEHCQFAYFDADWTPQLLGERGAALPDGEDERARALRRLAHEFKITWGPLWARMVVYSAAFLGGLAGLEALISSAG